MEKKQYLSFFRNIDWKIKGKNTLTILRCISLMLLETMVIVAITQMLQIGNVDKGLIWVIMHKKIFAVTSLSLTVLGVSLCALIGRFWTSNTILLTFEIVFAFTNQQKLAARSETLLPSDLIFIKEPDEMLKMADQSMLLKIIFGLILLILLTVLLEKFFPLKWQNLKRFWVIRIIIIGMTILGLSNFNKINTADSAMNDLSNWMGNKIYFWDARSAGNDNGPWLTFVNFLGTKG